MQHSSGVQILPAPLHPTEWGALHRHHIAKVIELLSQTHDYVVVDTPGAFNELVATALETADIILLVTSMDIASIKDTALALEMLRAAAVSEDKVKLVINHSTVVEQPAPRRRRARARVRGLLAHPARRRREQQQPARASRSSWRSRTLALRGRSPTWLTASPACAGTRRDSSTESSVAREQEEPN